MIQWIVSNQAWLIGTAYGIVCVVNRMLPASVGPAWLHSALGRLAAFDKEGNFSVPLLQGNGGGK